MTFRARNTCTADRFRQSIVHGTPLGGCRTKGAIAMRIATIGTGYVGLVPGACLEDFGCAIVGIDKNEAKLALVRDGKSPIFRQGLDALLERNSGA